MRFLCSALVGLMSVTALCTDFTLVPLDLGSGYSVAGTISTDGTVGPLRGSNLTNWDIVVTQASDLAVYTPANTANWSTQLTSDGQHLLVPTSPDGVSDGGALWLWGGTRIQARVADFTGLNVGGGSCYFVHGSVFDEILLNQPNNSLYTAAVRSQQGVNRFDLVPKDFGNGIVLSGWVQTNAPTGNVILVDWRITVHETTTYRFTPANSRVLSDFNLSSDGHQLSVNPFDAYGNGGALSMGRGIYDLTAVILADFTLDPGGQAGYVSPLVYQMTSPLTLDPKGDYVIARVARNEEEILPSSFQVTIGQDPTGGLSDLYTSNDSWLMVFNDPATLGAEVEFQGHASGGGGVSLDFLFEGSAARGGLAQRVYLYSWPLARWTLMHGAIAPTSDESIQITTSLASAFVDVNGAIKAKVSWQPINDEAPSQDGWVHQIDVAKWYLAR